MGRQTCLEVGCVPQGHVVTKHFLVFYSVHLEYNKAKTSSVQEIYNINNRALLFKMNEPVQTLTWVLAGELRKATCSKPSGPRRPAVQKLRLLQPGPKFHLGQIPAISASLKILLILNKCGF